MGLKNVVCMNAVCSFIYRRLCTVGWLLGVRELIDLVISAGVSDLKCVSYSFTKLDSEKEGMSDGSSLLEFVKITGKLLLSLFIAAIPS